MKPYKNLRNQYELNEHPDNQEVHQAGRKSSHWYGKKHGGIKNKADKATARRRMKRRDKRAQEKLDRKDGDQ